MNYIICGVGRLFTPIGCAPIERSCFLKIPRDEGQIFGESGLLWEMEGWKIHSFNSAIFFHIMYAIELWNSRWSAFSERLQSWRTFALQRNSFDTTAAAKIQKPYVWLTRWRDWFGLTAMEFLGIDWQWMEGGGGEDALGDCCSAAFF